MECEKLDECVHIYAKLCIEGVTLPVCTVGLWTTQSCCLSIYGINPFHTEGQSVLDWNALKANTQYPMYGPIIGIWGYENAQQPGCRQSRCT